ncbi:glycosyltransferase [Coleofasciculus sp. LEGE 07092]|nr:glycosyltransferase [Coleofasciculus sp. LEGE 07081]MBE9147197.1 glycosyltransferase [Coleofasciculus sp. LEGE 07092]
MDVKANPLLNRLNKTRLSRWAHDVRQCFNSFYNYNQLLDYIQHNKPDLIVTVAHGELCWLAQQLSQRFNIPLVTFFHDWWPALAYVHDWARGRIASRFRRLYQQSQLSLCVSEGMRQALGTHSNAKVLLPIPDNSVLVTTTEKLTCQGKFNVIYAGILSGIYSSMLQALCKSVQQIHEFQLKLFGLKPDWSDFLLQQVRAEGIYAGFISRELLTDELNKGNALLVVMSFEQRDKTRMQTSFPSKLVDYCQFGKPIIIWGPDYCSAVQWGRQYQSALLITSPLVQDLVTAIKRLAIHPEEQKRLGNKALEMAKGMFNPEKIQRRFMESIQQVAAVKY